MRHQSALVAGCLLVSTHLPRTGRLALHFAAQNGHVDVVQLLARSQKALTGSTNLLDRLTTAGSTALYLAAERGHVEVLKALLKAGADPNKAVSTQPLRSILAVRTCEGVL